MCQPEKHRQAHYAMLLGIAWATTSWATTGWAQEADAPDEDRSDIATQVEASASDETVSEDSVSEASMAEEPVSEEIDVDDGSYIDAEDDDFRPSEEISADESITFPTDI